MIDLIRQLEKAELHVHLEGSVEPSTVLELDPSLTSEEVERRYSHSDFAGFIQSYVWVNRLLKTPGDYGLIARRFFDSIEAQNVVYVEVNLSVGVMLWKGHDPLAIFAAVDAEAQRSTVKVRWIFDAVRQFGPEPGMQVAELAAELRPRGVVAFGIGGIEEQGPAENFYEVFAEAKRNGLKLVPHAGETAGPESVWAALKGGADRIGHGIRSIEDPALLAELRARDVPLEISIGSNVCTGAVSSLDAHPVRKLYDSGVPITLNTDDPALFRTTLIDEYACAAEKFGFSERELRELASNSLRYACAL